MAHLIPYPLGRLVSRVLRELDGDGPVLDYPRAKVVRGLPGRDLSTSVHGHLAATPLGPAAGPHTQLAQNIVLAYLGGCRIFELKTVQMMDELVIPRPCIDMRTVGFNVEWSQELELEQSLEEYVKASMLLEVAIASGKLQLAPGFERFAFDLSVGYDLKGISGEPVQAFLRGHDGRQAPSSTGCARSCRRSSATSTSAPGSPTRSRSPRSTAARRARSRASAAS